MQPKWSQGGWSTMIARHPVAEDPTEAKLVWSWSPDRSRGWPKENDFCIYSHLIWWISLDLRLKDCWIILVGLLDISCSKSFVIVLMGETGQGVIPRDAPVFDASHTEIDAKSCQSLDGFWHSLGYARCLSLVSIWMVKCFRAMMKQLRFFISFWKYSFFFNAPWCSSFGHFRIHLCDYAVQTCDMPRAMTLPFNHDDLDIYIIKFQNNYHDDHLFFVLGWDVVPRTLRHLTCLLANVLSPKDSVKSWEVDRLTPQFKHQLNYLHK